MQAAPFLVVRFLIPAVFALAAAHAAQAREGPILSLDPGGHMSFIRAVLFTPDGKQLVSAADDKVIRVWDVDTEQTLRVLRGQIGAGSRGKIYALALSPDARLLAAGGRIREAGEGSNPIRLYDFRTGEMLALLDGHRGAVLSLDFSPDGRFIVSGSTDNMAIVWDVEKRQEVHRLRGHEGDINRAVFTIDGARIVTGSDDRTLALWDVENGALLARSEPHAGVIFGVAISPVTGDVASASEGGEVRLTDDRTLRKLRGFERQSSDMQRISFSADGKQLVAGVGTAPYRVFVFDVESGRLQRTYNGHDHLVFATATSPQGRLAATAGGNNNEIHIWDMQTGKVAKKLRGSGQGAWAVGFSKDGGSLAWGHSHREKSFNDRGPLEFTLRLPKADRAMGEPRPLAGRTAAFRRAVARLKKLRLNHRVGGDWGYYADLDVLSKGRVRATIRRDEKSGFAHNAYSLTPDGREIITGAGNGWLSVFNTSGRKRGDFVGHASDIWAVAVSADGRLLISGSDDQTVRLWNIDTRENIVSLFYGLDGEWIIWTPQGYYAASPSGDKHVGWHINQGDAKAARYVTAAQLKQQFYRPDIIRRSLELASARKAIDEATGTDFSLNELLSRRPPAFEVTTPENNSKVGRSPTDLTLGIEANLDFVDGYDVTVNGRKVVSRAEGNPAGKNSEDHEVNFQIPLSSGKNQIEIVAYNAVGKTVRDVSVEHTGQPDLDKRGTLYIVSIGVDKYPNLPGADLDFAEIDAKAFRDLLDKRAGPLHNAVESQLLVTEGALAPTAENIRATLEDLSRAGPRDTIAVFLAGHGKNQGADYFFVSTDAIGTDAGKLKPATVVSWRDLHKTLESSRGQRILFLDTCHAGNAYNARLIKDAADDKIAVLAATDAETLANEEPELGHGVFTYSLLEGLRGLADSEGDGRVQVGELSDFVVKHVVKLTQGRQTPTGYISSGRFFVLADQ